MMQAIKVVHFLVRRKLATTRGCHSCADSGTLFVGEPVHASATRFDFASNVGELFLVLFGPRLNLLQQCLCSRTHAVNIARLRSSAIRRTGLQSTFAGSGCSEAEFATRAALAIPARAAIFFCWSEPGCTTPQDMIRVAASSVLMSTSMILLLGT